MDRYGTNVLAQAHTPRGIPEVEGVADLVVECADTRWCGAVVGWEKTAQGWTVALEDRHGRRRLFPAESGAFRLEGTVVTLVRPQPRVEATPRRTASGAIAGPEQPASVARASRIWVEGMHDAELLERIWGSDLRQLGIVVEPVGGIDDLIEQVAGFEPGPLRRLAVLVDHLMPGTKESRIAAQAASRWPDHVLVLGHPFVDIWQAVRPGVVGIEAWPTIPRGRPWKAGVIAALGWWEDEPAAWQRILDCVRGYADLEPSLLGRVEEAIDFVSANPG
jgi:hypothetical protein